MVDIRTESNKLHAAILEKVIKRPIIRFPRAFVPLARKQFGTLDAVLQLNFAGKKLHEVDLLLMRVGLRHAVEGSFRRLALDIVGIASFVPNRCAFFKKVLGSFIFVVEVTLLDSAALSQFASLLFGTGLCECDHDKVGRDEQSGELTYVNAAVGGSDRDAGKQSRKGVLRENHSCWCLFVALKGKL